MHGRLPTECGIFLCAAVLGSPSCSFLSIDVAAMTNRSCAQPEHGENYTYTDREYIEAAAAPDWIHSFRLRPPSDTSLHERTCSANVMDELKTQQCGWIWSVYCRCISYNHRGCRMESYMQ
ncbi:hypothetical protein PMIN06_007447 [Paraphaeosphaeria minitans]